jgi:hypothetical protein
MITDLQVFPMQNDSSFVALQGRLDRAPVNVRIQRTVIDDLDSYSPGKPTEAQRISFVRDNRELLTAIVQAKIDRGETATEEWFGREALSVVVSDTDFLDYLSEPGARLSFAAFDPLLQVGWGSALERKLSAFETSRHGGEAMASHTAHPDANSK